MKRIFSQSLTLVAVTFLSIVTYSQTTPSAAAKVDPIRVERLGSGAKSAAPVTTEMIEKDVSEALSVIEKGHVDGKALNYNELFKTTIETMLHTLDPHSNYFDAKDNEAFRAEQNSEYYGIGATIGDLSDPEGKVIATYIKATFVGAPANLAGLKYGDKIIEVNGKSMLGKPLGEVRSYLRGVKGTIARIVVEHAANGRTSTYEVTRGAVSQPSISEAYMIRPSVGYMALHGGFNRTTFAEFVADMTSLRSHGMRQLVLDLRDNPGGLVEQACNIANVFLSAGQTVLTQKGRMERSGQILRVKNPMPDKSPVVVLVNRGSASASEILAGALQDHDRALIVGEGTFGKGLVQFPFQDIGYDSMLLLTIAKYQTPSGRLIQRDYSNGDLYNYYTDGGSFRDENSDETPKGVASRTDTGRQVYSGGGITPDVLVKPRTITLERGRVEQKIASPVFAYALDLVNGRVKGFENYKVDKAVVYDYDITASDYTITPELFQGFKQYAAETYKIPASQVDSEREFVERTLRSELVTAAYGSQTSFQVSNEYDDQLLKAIDLLPEAKQLAIKSERARTATSKESNPAN